MTRHGWIAALMCVTGLTAVGFGLLTAQEPGIPRQRVSPKLLKEAANDPVVITATAPPSVGRTIQELRTLADEMEKAGNKADATRLKVAIREIVRRAELEINEKKAQVTRLTAEIEDLKWAVVQ